VPDRAYTDDELDAAVAAISDPGRLTEAQDLVMRTAPALQRVLGSALAEGGWFDTAHEQAMRDVAAAEDPEERVTRVRTMLAEETRLGMLVGVAVGFELARELNPTDPSKQEDR
jgi:Lon protease-like protein